MSEKIIAHELQILRTCSVELGKVKEEAQAYKMKIEEDKNAVLKLSAQLEKFNKPFNMDEHWCFEECDFICEILRNWVDLLPKAHELTGQWPIIHKFLIQHNAIVFDSAKRLGTLTKSEVDLLFFAVSSILWKRLCEPLLIGATAEQRLLLKTIHKDLAMRNEGTPRDPEATAYVKAEMFWTFASSKAYSKKLKAECHQAAELIAQLLEELGFNEEHFDDDKHCRSMMDHINQLEEDVARPMAKLATKIQCSASQYIWKWQLPHPFVKKPHLDYLEVLDLDTHCIIWQPAAHFSALSNDDPFAWSFFPIFPAIYRVMGGGQPAYPVSKGIVAVKPLKGYDFFTPPEHAISDVPDESEHPLYASTDHNRKFNLPAPAFATNRARRKSI